MTAALTINQKNTKPDAHDDLITLYEDACEKRNVVVGYLSMEEIQDAYGLYKQSGFGDAPNTSEGLNDFQQKKREAWIQFVGVSAEEAKKKYIAIVASGLKKREKARVGKVDREKALQLMGTADKVSQQSVKENRSIAYLGLGDNYLEMGDWKHLGPELYLEEFGEIQFNERSKITLPTASYEDYEKLQLAYEKSLPYFLARANENFTPKSMLTVKGTAKLGAQAKMFFRIDNDKPLNCYLKHSNTTSSNGEFEHSLDDRNVTTYRASLKLQMPGGGEFDLPMVSGRTFFPDYENFFSFLTARKPIYEIIKDNPFAFYTAIETQRMAPSSYTGVIYHSAIPMKSQTPVGCLYFKFRLLRDGLSVEEGLLDEETQRKLLKTTNIRKEGASEPFYLRNEYQSRLNESEISYRFQAQIYNPALDDTDERVRLNPAIPWSESEFPWFDMATIDITSILSDQSQHEIVMNPVSLSQSQLFAVPEPRSIYDYSAHSWVRNRMYPYFRLAKFGPTLQIKDSKGGNVTILFFSGFKGLDDFDNTSTQLILHSDKNTSYTLNIENPLQQGVQIEGEYGYRILLPRDLQIDVIEVGFEQKKALIFTKIKLVNAVGEQMFSCLATEDNNKHLFVDSQGLAVASRRFQGKGLLDQSLKGKQKLFNWPIAKGKLPPFGVFESFSEIPVWDQYEVRNQVYMNTKQLDEFRSDNLEEKGLKLKRFSDYRQLVESRFGDQLVPNEIMKSWQSDSQFATQYIAGAHPCMIELCKSVPNSFPDNALDEILVGGRDALYQAIEQKRIFIVDLDVLSGLKINLPAPIVLFYRDGDESLTPIAIQLDQENSGLVFTPNDSPNDWLSAKLWARFADSNVYQVCSHFLFSHIILDSFVIAMHRELPESHPIFQLLFPFSKNVIAGNMAADQVLVAEGGMFSQITGVPDVFQQLAERAWKNRSLRKEFSFVDSFESRSITVDELPDYPFRDDGLLLWNAIERYISKVIHIHYSSDADVKEDAYLQAWNISVVETGLKGCDLPPSIDTVDGLSALLTGFVFQSSAFHSAQNSQMFKQLGFIPNSPLKLVGKYPREKDQVRIQDIMNWFPDRDVCEKMVDMLAILGNRTLKGFFETEEKLIGEELCMSSHEGVRLAYAIFKDELIQISQTIHKRNEKRAVPYDGFLPENVTASASW